MPKKILGEDGLNIVVQQIKKRKTGKQRARMHNVIVPQVPVGTIPRPALAGSFGNARKKILTKKRWQRLQDKNLQINGNTLDRSKVYEGPYVIGANSDDYWDIITATPVQRRFEHSPFATIPILSLRIENDEIRHKLNFTSLYTLRKTRYHTAGHGVDDGRGVFYYYKRYISTSTARMKHKIKTIVDMSRNESDELEIFEYCSKWLNGAIIGICPLPGQSRPLLWYRITGLSVRQFDNKVQINAQCLPLFNHTPFKFPLP